MSSSPTRPYPTLAPPVVITDRNLPKSVPSVIVPSSNPPTDGLLQSPIDVSDDSERYPERGPSPPSRSSGEAERTRSEITSVISMLKELEVARFDVTDNKNPEELMKILNIDEVLRNHLIRLKTKLNKLEWRSLALRSEFFDLNPLVVERLLDIQKESASAIGALAVVGATLAISLMYSASRGNMWYPFLCVSDLLETDNYIDLESGDMARATKKNWLKQKISVVAVIFSLIGVAAGWAILAAGAAGYNLYNEIQQGNGPKIEDGPNLGPGGIKLFEKVIVYFIIGDFMVVLIGAYFYRLRGHL
ncbi:hypothetical protein DL93DRAFT_2153903 [Clavulina sp. PMI_390]|nr:hypothetical protein DL93DRAFT_2153903 [Clavulina sp. PMI_390]